TEFSLPQRMITLWSLCGTTPMWLVWRGTLMWFTVGRLSNTAISGATVVLQ
ncbi:hypothetical protein BgiBS90_011817, partial [Biomphalaria glabrata]